MTISMMCYKPKEGADIVILFKDEGKNICVKTALQLHKLYNDECIDNNHQSITRFIPNLVYTFKTGLAFRLFDDGASKGTQVLEFMCLGDKKAKKEALALLPDLLAQAGINDKEVLDKLRYLLAKPAQDKQI